MGNEEEDCITGDMDQWRERGWFGDAGGGFVGFQATC